MMLRRLVLAAAAVVALVPRSMLAQTTVVAGRVASAAGGAPLAGVRVSIVGAPPAASVVTGASGAWRWGGRSGWSGELEQGQRYGNGENGNGENERGENG